MTQSHKPVFRFLSALGNANILWHHILALEEDIKNQNENSVSDFTTAPHFSAWIRMISEYISNSLFDSYYQMSLKEEVYNYGFDKIINEIYNYHINNSSFKKAPDELKSIVNLVKIFVDLRHCFQHGGLPNIARRLKYTQPKEIDQLLNPQNFVSTKKMFMKALTFTSRLPKKSVGL
jgi:hypothetical protein